MSARGQDVVIVVGDRVIRTNRKALEVVLACAGQMFNDGDAFDYYKATLHRSQIKAGADLANALGGAVRSEPKR